VKTRRGIHFLLALFIINVGAAFAGGPLYVGGPNFGGDGKMLTWDPAKMPIQYRLDPGPLSSTIDHAAGALRIQNMLSVWQNVPTAAISFNNAGPILASGSYTGGDVATLAQYNAVSGSCNAAAQNPVIFDANGSLISALGMPPEVIGFTNICALDGASGHITAAMITLNGKMQDGVSTNGQSSSNYELTANEFDETIDHEFGHFIGLDHSQINLDLLYSYESNNNPCDLDEQAGMPLMFPIEFCDARKDVGLPLLAPDDIAWVSKLYPGSTQNLAYGVISGRIYFSDATSQYQGANVIARAVDDPHTPEDESRRIAVSVISGYLFTGNPGQSVTAEMSDPNEHNSNGSKFGSRNSQLIGYYEIPVPPGTYTVEIEPINNTFSGGSSLGPMIYPPQGFSAEFWNQGESAYDYLLERDDVIVNGGDKADSNDIILNSPNLSTYDNGEDGGMTMIVPALPFEASQMGEGL
jgi:hypothetical protein